MTGTARRGSPHFAMAWVATAVLVALCAFVLWNQRQESRRLSELALRNSAVLLTEQTEHSFEQVDALLRSVAYRYVRASSSGKPGLARLVDEVRNDVATNSFVKRIGIIDHNGVNFFNTGFTDANPPKPVARDRDYFRRAQAGDKALLFDGPLRPKLTPDWSLILARRIDGPDGQFLGVVFATIPVSAIGELFARVDVGRSGIINLRTSDLVQVVRVPAASASDAGVGNRNISQTIRDLMREHPGLDHYVYHTVAPIDGTERIYTYQRFRHAPFWMTVGHATDDIAGAWYRTAASLGMVVVPVSLFFFWIARRLRRESLMLAQGIEDKTRDLARSERFFRSLTDTLPSMIGYWDAELRNRFANAAFEAWFGRSPGELLGRHVGEILEPQQLAKAEPFYRAAFAGEPQTFERQQTRHDGQVGDMLVTLTPDLVDGHVQGVFSQAIDITERKRAEEEIRRQSIELDDLYNEAPCGYHSLDAQGVVQRMNDTELTWLGYTRDEVIGRRIDDFLTPASIETLRQNLPRLLATGALAEIEIELARRDGGTFPVLASTTVSRDAQGNLAGTRSALLDYSRLRLEQATLRRVLEASPMAVRVARLQDNRILFLNRAYCELVRRSEDEARDMDISTVYVDPVAFAEIRDRLRHGEMVLNRLVELYLPDRPEAPSVWALASYMTIEYDGQPAALAWLFDVTELHQARASAEAASRAKSSFLANMSHEIRTPMNAIMGLTHLLLRDEQHASQRDRLDKVQAASRHLLQVINDILDLSKIEAGQMTLEKRAFVVDDVVRRAMDLIRPKADEKKLELVFDTDHLPPRLLGDATRVVQMLINLLGNAVKFTAVGWVRLRCERVSEDAAALTVRFEVQDTGPGVPAELQSRLFNAFEQGDTSTTRLHGGTGLGLALTRHFAQLMGGDSGMTSTAGSGSTFWFTARFEKVADDAAPGHGVPIGSAGARLRELHAGAAILLAEDNPINQEVAVSLLQAVGLHVDTAADGPAAVALAEKKPYALILMDMQMPGMDGLEATRRIRRLAAPATPIIAMTANAFAEDRAACLAAGMNDHLSKPVEPENLYAMLLRWLPAPGQPTQRSDELQQGQLADQLTDALPERLPDQLEKQLTRIEGYDLELGLTAVGRRPGILVKLLERFASLYREGDATLLTARAARNWRAMAHASHALRGACATIGATRAVALTKALDADLAAVTAPATAAPDDAAAQAAALRLNDELTRLAAAFASALSG